MVTLHEATSSLIMPTVLQTAVRGTTHIGVVSRQCLTSSPDDVISFPNDKSIVPDLTYLRQQLLSGAFDECTVHIVHHPCSYLLAQS